jgi:hypothetical protein
MLTAYLFARNIIFLLVGSAKCVEFIWESEQVAIKNLAIITHLLFTFPSALPERRLCRREFCHRPKYSMKTVKIRITIKDSRKSIYMTLFLQIIFRAVGRVAANYVKKSLKVCGISD